MDSIKSRVSYLKGLIDGLGIEKNSNEGRVLIEIASILGDMAEEIEDLEYAQEEIEDYVDAIDEDLSDVEDELYCDEDCDDDCDCYDEDYDNYIELKCPHCNETIYIDSEICDCNEEITCPNCHKELSFDCACNDEYND